MRPLLVLSTLVVTLLVISTKFSIYLSGLVKKFTPLKTDYSLIFPWNGFAAFPGLVFCLLGILALLWLFSAVNRLFSARRFLPLTRPARYFTLMVLYLFGLSLVLQGIGLWLSGLSGNNGLPTLVTKNSTVSSVNSADLPKHLRVLSYNTRGGDTSATDLLPVILKNQVDVVVLVETTAKMGTELRDLLAAKGHDYQLYTNEVGAYEAAYRSNLILTSADLGEFKVTDFKSDATMFLSIASISEHSKFPGFELAAVHVIRPSDKHQESWAKNLSAARDWCNSHSTALLAGDFNATLQHGALRNLGACLDASTSSIKAASGGWGTWPTTWPAFIGTAIDHILVNKHSWSPASTALVQLGASDHRGVIADLVWQAK